MRFGADYSFTPRPTLNRDELGGPDPAKALGGLISYSTNRSEIFWQAGNYAGQILKGENPADLPVARSTKFETIVNLKTAKAMGLSVAQPILLRADGVIE